MVVVVGFDVWNTTGNIEDSLKIDPWAHYVMSLVLLKTTLVLGLHETKIM